MNDALEARWRTHASQAELAFLAECFGDELARTGRVEASLRGRDALEAYLINKHHWLPSTVRALSWEDLRCALHSELQAWRAAPEVLACVGRLAREREPSGTPPQPGSP